MNNRSEWLTTIMTEYKEIHNEALKALGMQHSTLRFGIAALALIVTASGYFYPIVQKPNDGVPGSLLFFVPLAVFVVSCTILFVWLHEVSRMVRTTTRLKEIEATVNIAFPDKPNPLDWARRLRPSFATILSYSAVLLLFLFLAVLAVLVAYSRINDVHPPLSTMSIIVVSVIGAATVCIVIARCCEIVRY